MSTDEDTRRSEQTVPVVHSADPASNSIESESVGPSKSGYSRKQKILIVLLLLVIGPAVSINGRRLYRMYFVRPGSAPTENGGSFKPMIALPKPCSSCLRRWRSCLRSLRSRRRG